jgi:hypothetical protein
MRRRTFFATAFAAAAFACSAKVHASPDYPAAIREKALLAYLPACTLCHAESDGSDGAVATDFGRTLWVLGMRGRNVPSLEIALDKVRARKWDADGDGVDDIAELVGSTDPSGPALSNFPAAEHGCAVGLRRGAPAFFGSTASVAFFAGAFAASRLRRRRDTRLPSQFRRPV